MIKKLKSFKQVLDENPHIFIDGDPVFNLCTMYSIVKEMYESFGEKIEVISEYGYFTDKRGYIFNSEWFV